GAGSAGSAPTVADAKLGVWEWRRILYAEEGRDFLAPRFLPADFDRRSGRLILQRLDAGPARTAAVSPVADAHAGAARVAGARSVAASGLHAPVRTPPVGRVPDVCPN